jgi:transmembrane sensor
MDIPSIPKEHISAEAVEWFLRLQKSDRSGADGEAFSEWLLRSPAHVEEYLALAQTWAGMTLPNEGEFSTDSLIEAARRPDPDNIVRLGNYNTSIVRSRSFRHRRARAVWVAVAAAIIVGAGVWLIGGPLRLGLEVRTAVGEQRSITLDDGSVVFLNTDTDIRARLTAAERRIELIRGEARFQVAKDRNRPFLVSTSDATVKAVGTVFNVRATAADTEVAVMEGIVEVSSRPKTLSILSASDSAQPPPAKHVQNDAPHIRLSAGERAAITPDTIQPNAGPSIERASAWLERRLVFRGEALSDVVAEFNRYRVQPLVLDDSQLAQIRISGVFDSGDPESLIAYLTSFETVKVERLGDGTLRLSHADPR